MLQNGKCNASWNGASGLCSESCIFKAIILLNVLKIVLRSYFNVAQTQCIYNKNTLYFQLEFLSGEDTADALAKLKRFI